MHSIRTRLLDFVNDPLALNSMSDVIDVNIAVSTQPFEKLKSRSALSMIDSSPSLRGPKSHFDISMAISRHMPFFRNMRADEGSYARGEDLRRESVITQ
jgi:hypothetical protein